MRWPKAAKPATAAGGEPASKFDQLDGRVGFHATHPDGKDQAAGSDSDRRFFKCRPGRRFRLRRAFPGERRIAALAGGAPLPDGRSDFVVVEQIVPGVRTRIGFRAASDLETDIGDEEIARLLQVRS
jgi:hypothetical protein